MRGKSSIFGTTGQEEDVSLGLPLGIENEDDTEESRAETRVTNTCPGAVVETRGEARPTPWTFQCWYATEVSKCRVFAGEPRNSALPPSAGLKLVGLAPPGLPSSSWPCILAPLSSFHRPTPAKDELGRLHADPLQELHQPHEEQPQALLETGFSHAKVQQVDTEKVGRDGTKSYL